MCRNVDTFVEIRNLTLKMYLLKPYFPNKIFYIRPLRLLMIFHHHLLNSDLLKISISTLPSPPPFFLICPLVLKIVDKISHICICFLTIFIDQSYKQFYILHSMQRPFLKLYHTLGASPSPPPTPFVRLLRNLAYIAPRVLAFRPFQWPLCYIHQTYVRIIKPNK